MRMLLPGAARRPKASKKEKRNSWRNNAYAFEVATAASKADIRRAVEELFQVRVSKVAVQNRLGKMRRSRMRRGSTKPWKKAIVTLNAEDKITLF